MALWVNANPIVPPGGIVEATGWLKMRVPLAAGLGGVRMPRQ